MPSVISGIPTRIQGRTALVVGFLILAASVALWLPATGILHAHMIDLNTYREAARQSGEGAQNRIYTNLFGSPVAGPFLYPPFAAAMIMGVDGHSLTTLSWYLSAISAFSLLITIYVILRKLTPHWSRQTTVGWTMGLAGLAMWLDPVERTFTFGQVSLILLALVAVDLTRPDHSRWKGVGIGLAVGIKLTPAIFLVYLLLTRRFRASVTAGAVFLGTVVIGWLVLPIASPKFWFKAISRNNDVINPHTTVGDSTSQSLRALLYRMLHTPATAGHPAHDSALLNPLWYLLCAAVAVVGLYAAVRFHRRGDELGAIVIVAAVGLLVSPISWTHHWVWIVPALMVLGHRVLTTRNRRLAAGLAGTGMLFFAYPMTLLSTGMWTSHEPWGTHLAVPWRPYSVVWTTPHQDGREFHWTAWNFLVGNLYVFAALAFVGLCGWLSWTRRGEDPALSAAADEAPAPREPLLVTAKAALARANATLGRFRQRRVFEPVAVAVVSATLLLTRLMVPNTVGVADNSDGGRLLCHDNLVPAGSGSDLLQKFVAFKYVFKAGPGCNQAKYVGNDLPHPAYESSQLILIQLGRWATRLLGLGALDLRVLGLVCCLLIGLAIGLLFAVLRCRRPVRYGLCAALLLVTADASFIDFAVSPLSEISAIIGTLFLLPAVILLFRGGRDRRYGLALGLAAGLFLTMSKAQMLLLAVPIGIFLAAFPLEATLLRGRVNLRGRVGRRILPVAAGCALLGGTILLTPAQDPHQAILTQGDFVFVRLLGSSPNPAADLKSLGIPGGYSDLVGKEVLCPSHHIGSVPVVTADGTPVLGADGQQVYAASGTVTDPGLANGISRGTVAKFLLSHPDRAVRVMNSAAADFFHVRPTYSAFCTGQNTDLGNYAPSSGKAANSVDPIAPVADVFGLFKSLGLIPLLLLWAVPFGAALHLLLRRRRRSTGDAAALAWSTVLLTVIGATQFVVSVFGDGIDTPKHLNLSIYATAAAVVTAVAAWVLRSRADETVAEAAETADSDLPSPRIASESIGHQA